MPKKEKEQETVGKRFQDKVASLYTVEAKKSGEKKKGKHSKKNDDEDED